MHGDFHVFPPFLQPSLRIPLANNVGTRCGSSGQRSVCVPGYVVFSGSRKATTYWPAELLWAPFDSKFLKHKRVRQLLFRSSLSL